MYSQLDRALGLKKRSFFFGLGLVLAASTADARTLIFQAEPEPTPSTVAIPSPAVSPNSNSEANPSVSTSSVNYSVAQNRVGGSSVNSELLSMIEQLQEEVQQLRGVVEEQAHEIKVLKKRAKSRYLDLDERVLSLSKKITGTQMGEASASPQAVNVQENMQNANVSAGNASTGVVSASDVSVSMVDPKVSASVNSSDVYSSKLSENSAKVVPVVTHTSEGEQRAYDAAYSLVKAKKFEQAIKQFYEFIDKYPEGSLAGNAYYWLGEVYLVLPQLEQAEQAFSIVVQAYPDHAKVADALYKLGVTLDRLQKPAQSEKYLLQVQKDYPGTTAAKLANNYKINR